MKITSLHHLNRTLIRFPHNLKTQVIISDSQMHIPDLSEPSCNQWHLTPSHTELLRWNLPNVFSCPTTSLSFGSFIIFIIIIRRILLFSLSTLSLRLFFNTRFGHCPKMRREKMAKVLLHHLVSIQIHVTVYLKQRYTGLLKGTLEMHVPRPHSLRF